MNWTKVRFALLSKRFVGQMLVWLFYGKLSKYTSARFGGHDFDFEIDRQIKVFLPDHKLGLAQYKRLKADIIWSYYRFGATPVEYFLFDFSHCSAKRRAQFLTTKHKDDVMRKLVGMGDKGWKMLEDKYKFYLNFKNFFGRDVLLMNADTQENGFLTFVEKHPSFMVKPLDGQCGKGIERMCVADFNDDAHKLFCSLHQEDRAYLIEEVIKQCAEFSAINASSVNTVRLPTFMNKSGFHVLKPFFRMGRNGSVVDNANSGGVFCVVDEETGMLLTDAMDKQGRFYERHPDSHHQLKGWVIPKWNELLEFAFKIHNTISWYPYVGWDFALTENGWVLIEGNWGQFVTEYADKEGIKERFDAMFDAL